MKLLLQVHHALLRRTAMPYEGGGGEGVKAYIMAWGNFIKQFYHVSGVVHRVYCKTRHQPVCRLDRVQM